MKTGSVLLVATPLLLASAATHADDLATAEQVSSAVKLAIPLLEAGSAGSAENRKCFTCHSQALPIVALSEARKRGFAINEENLKRQITHTEEHLKRGRKNYDSGKGQGGRVITAGYALWALEAGDFESDDTTTSVTGYLLKYQKDKNHWSQPGQRPPSSGSDFTNTYLALRALEVFSADDQSEAVKARVEKVRPWVLETEPVDTEDRVFRLRSLAYVDAESDVIDAAVAGVIESQLDDGGWAQTADLKSDAYATSTVLVALLRDGGVAADDPAIQRGVQYLLETQQDDGSWHVVTRAKGFQTYFESGFPHGKDQFISITASSWATTALLLTLPESAAAKNVSQK